MGAITEINIPVLLGNLPPFSLHEGTYDRAAFAAPCAVLAGSVKSIKTLLVPRSPNGGSVTFDIAHLPESFHGPLKQIFAIHSAQHGLTAQTKCQIQMAHGLPEEDSHSPEPHFIAPINDYPRNTFSPGHSYMVCSEPHIVFCNQAFVLPAHPTDRDMASALKARLSSQMHHNPEFEIGAHTIVQTHAYGVYLLRSDIKKPRSTLIAHIS